MYRTEEIRNRIDDVSGCEYVWYNTQCMEELHNIASVMREGAECTVR